MAAIYVCKKKSQWKLENCRTVGVFYFVGPVLRHCDFSRIQGEEDVLRYFREKSPETIKYQAEFPIPEVNPWKIPSAEFVKKALWRECIGNKLTCGSALLRYNSKSEGYQRFEEFAGEGDIVVDDVPLDFLYSLVIPPIHFTPEEWKHFFDPGRNPVHIISKYMRKRWVEENGLNILEPLSEGEKEE